MFRRPYSRPPQNSFFQRGSPAALSFRTTDRQPMQMEAHHKLERPIELRCCSLVRVAIWNADHNPGQVALELSLVNTELAGSPSQSLGVVPVRSAPDPHKEPVTAVPETLEFRIPADSKLPAFNEFQVVFQRDGKHVSRSAKIAIDHFVLVPRGL